MIKIAKKQGFDELIKKKEEIEEKIRKREKDLFSLKEEIVLYDLTSTYFEGVKYFTE